MIDDYKLMMNTFYGITGLTIYCFDNCELVHNVPNTVEKIDAHSPIFIALTNEKNYISYLFSENGSLYGKVEILNRKTIFILCLTPPSHKQDYFINKSLMDKHSFEFFLNALSYFNYSLNHTFISIEQLISLGNQSYVSENKINDELTKILYQAKEEEYIHHTYQLEQKMITYVKSGNTYKLLEWFKHAAIIEGGPVANDMLRQARNISIISVTLVARAAIEGGLNIEIAFHLSDIYIQKIEKLSRLDAISLLMQQMVIDFSNRVANLNLPKAASSLTLKAIQFIQNNSHLPIKCSDVAKYVGLSVAYFSHKFKNETGFNVSIFIIKNRIEEAKNLLAFSDKSLSEISHYLSFSSQSYFQNQFKELVGKSPVQYRNDLRK